MDNQRFGRNRADVLYGATWVSADATTGAGGSRAGPRGTEPWELPSIPATGLCGRLSIRQAGRVRASIDRTTGRPNRVGSRVPAKMRWRGFWLGLPRRAIGPTEAEPSSGWAQAGEERCPMVGSTDINHPRGHGRISAGLALALLALTSLVAAGPPSSDLGARTPGARPAAAVSRGDQDRARRGWRQRPSVADHCRPVHHGLVPAGPGPVLARSASRTVDDPEPYRPSWS